MLIDSTGPQVFGAGQWLGAKHGPKSRRTWRKLHLAVDAAGGMIVAQTLTDQDTDDPSQVDQIGAPVGKVTADGAYDGVPTYRKIAAHGDEIEVVILPRSTAVPTGKSGPPTQRDRHLAMIEERGRLAWQTATGYGQRSLIETTMGRYKSLIGQRLGARGFAGRQTEAAIGVAVLNRMLEAGGPGSVLRQSAIATPFQRLNMFPDGHLRPSQTWGATIAAQKIRGRNGVMEWRVTIELSGADGTTQIHDVARGGGADPRPSVSPLPAPSPEPCRAVLAASASNAE